MKAIRVMLPLVAILAIFVILVRYVTRDTHYLAEKDSVIPDFEDCPVLEDSLKIEIIKSSNGTVKTVVSHFEISYLSSNPEHGKGTIYHFVNEESVGNSNRFTQIDFLRGEAYFVQVHKAFWINLYHYRSHTKNQVYLKRYKEAIYTEDRGRRKLLLLELKHELIPVPIGSNYLKDFEKALQYWKSRS